MATRNNAGTNILAKQSGAKRPRKKRAPPEPRQYTITDLARAQDRVEAAERRVDSDHSNQRHSLTGLERARHELHLIEADLRARGLIK
jgi:hypothetical protein